jgi:CBS domain-containing protein
MEIVGVGKRVRMYVGEADLWHGRPLYLAIIETLRAEGCAGATAFRGIAGFGAHSRIHAATIEVLSADLPIVVEWIDAPDRVERVLPKITPMVSQGMITVEDVFITYYQHRRVDDISGPLHVEDVMTRNPVRVRPELPLRDAVEILVGRDYRALPVVDAQDRVVGIVTNSDLVERGGLRARIELLGVLTAEQLAAELAVVEKGKTVADVMTQPAVTVGPQTSLADAAHLMVTRQLKRLPVVDASGVLLGIVSRADLLRTRAEAYPLPWIDTTPRMGRTIGDVMRTDIPVVGRMAPLAEVLDAVVSTRLNRALVVDDERRVVGVVTDAEMLRRLSPEDHPSIVRILMSRLPFVHVSQEEKENLAHALGMTAEALMDRNVPTVPTDMPLGEAIEIMLRDRRKLLPVVDSAGRLVGAADRADLLRTLVAIEDEMHLS